MDDRADDERIGYKRPPRDGQFRKGQSGNPGGRPKRKKVEQIPAADPERESDAVLRKLLSRRHVVIEGGKQIEMTMLEILRHKQIKLAAEGNPHALREVHRDVERSEARKEARERAMAEIEASSAKERAEEEMRIFRFLRSLRLEQARKWKAALAQGQVEPDEPWPHPDDIILSKDGTQYLVRGPLNAEDLPRWEELRRLRDYFVAEMVLAICTDAPALVWKLWLGLMALTDRDLPARWQVLHDLNAASGPLMMMRLPRLEAVVSAERDWFERTFEAPTMRSKQQYRSANMLFGPVLRSLGYRSLRHFERVCEDTGGEPALPRLRSG
jgi:hypothetical protein